MGKILHFSACRGEECFTAPRNASRRGGFSFIPAPSRPTGGTKLALLGSTSAQAVQNSPSTRKTPQNQRFFASRANFVSSHPESTPAGRVFSRRWVPQPPQNARRLPRLKPMTPMREDHCHEMKPLTPLLPQNSQFQAIFRPRRRRRFHPPLTEHPQRRRRFHQTRNRAGGSQQGAQTLMLAASAVALIASGQFDSKEMP